MNDSKRVAYNTVTQVIARGITTLLSLAAIAYMLRYLGVDGYGQYTLIFAYLSIFSIFTDFGFFLLQVREITKHPDEEAKIAGNVFGLKLILSGVVFTLGYLGALVFYDNPVLTTGILIGAFSQAAIAVAQVPVSIFQARLEMHKVAIINVISRAIYLGLIIYGVQNQLGIVGLVLMTAIANLIMWTISWTWVNRTFALIPRFDFGYWRTFVKEALPLGAALVLAGIYFRVDTIMLGALQDTYAVGIYGAPYKIIEVILSVSTIFLASVFPILTEALSSSRERAERIFQKTYEVMHLLAWPIIFGITFVGTPLMILISGNLEFEPSGGVLKILIWAVGLSFIGGTFNYALIASGRQRLLTLPYLLATLFNIITNWIFIPKYSYTGAAITTVATEFLVVVMMFILMHKTLKLTPTLKVPLKAMISGGVMFAVLWALDSSNIWLNIGLGMAVYGGMILILGAINRQSIRELIKPA